VLALVVLLIVTTILDSTFWTSANLQNLLSQNVGLMLCACGMTFVIIAGGFDLSVGSVYAAGAMFYISFLGQLPAPLAVILSLLLGLGMGAVNGIIINVMRVNPFVATLGTSAIAVVIVGGTALTGGEGAIWRTVVGLAIIAVIVNLFTSLNFSPDLQTVFEGLIVILAVAMDVWILHQRAR